jgi:CBS domain-containing protein
MTGSTAALRKTSTHPTPTTRPRHVLQVLPGAGPHRNQVTAAMVMSSPVITVTVTDSLWDTWTLMSNCGVRHVAVVEGRHCVGVIDDRQLVAAWPQGPSAMQKTTVNQVLAPRIASALPETHLSEVAAIMNGGSVDAVPVVDEHGVLLGLLTAVDMVHAVARWGIHADLDRVAPTDGDSPQGFVPLALTPPEELAEVTTQTQHRIDTHLRDLIIEEFDEKPNVSRAHIRFAVHDGGVTAIAEGITVRHTTNRPTD